MHIIGSEGRSGVIVQVENQSAEQSLAATTTDEAVTAWDTEAKDANGEFNTTTGVFTVGASGAGTYIFTISMQMRAVGDNNYTAFMLYVNGTKWNGAADAIEGFLAADWGHGAKGWSSGSQSLDLNVGDTVTLNVFGVLNDVIDEHSFMTISKM